MENSTNHPIVLTAPVTTKPILTAVVMSVMQNVLEYLRITMYLISQNIRGIVASFDELFLTLNSMFNLQIACICETFLTAAVPDCHTHPRLFYIA